MPPIRATYHKHTLRFKQPSGTSRGVLVKKDSWFVHLETEDAGRHRGVGEVSLIPGLSHDAVPGFEKVLSDCCQEITASGKVEHEKYLKYPAIRFGLETAIKSLQSTHPYLLYPSEFTRGTSRISINGLIWMGEPGFMNRQIAEKLDAGFRCLKLKIGAIDFEEELQLLRLIRKSFDASQVELRVDANGAFPAGVALEKLKRLSEFELHSIEQPIRAGQYEAMAQLCSTSPIPIALDEELIGVFGPGEKKNLLNSIQPSYIILKPGLLGGVKAAEEWIRLATKRGIGWWVTSALESNVGLNAIAQWVYTLNTTMPQGLGTGQLYQNNVESPLFIEEGFLGYNPQQEWGPVF